MSTVMEMFVVYNHPRDYPDKFVLRAIRPTDEPPEPRTP